MKKIRYVILCLTFAVLVACAVGCSRKGSNGKTTTNGTSAGTTDTSGADSTKSGTSESGSSKAGVSSTSGSTEAASGSGQDSTQEGGRAGTTGSTEGETGVLDGLMEDGKDAMDDMMDENDGNGASNETEYGPGAPSNSTGAGSSGR